jgi:osomolarity two-component system phosphorelay intermediate protein YPD1
MIPPQTHDSDADMTQAATTKLGHMVYGDDIDRDTFEQVLEMDDDDERDFSREIVFDFFSQATTTFGEIHDAL